MKYNMRWSLQMREIIIEGKNLDGNIVNIRQEKHL